MRTRLPSSCLHSIGHLIAPSNGARLSCGAELKRSQTKDYNRNRGAVSFRRVLGCAPIIIARFPPQRRGSSALVTASLIITAGQNGPVRMTLGSRELAAPRPDETFIALPLHDGANPPDESVRLLGVVWRAVWKNGLAVFLIAQPNGVRLSCGATLSRSQTQFYNR